MQAQKLAKGVLAILSEGFSSNVYVLLDAGGALLIDSGSGESMPALDALTTSGIEIRKVLLTHGHSDHIHGLNYIPAEGYLHKKDFAILRELNSFMGEYSPPLNISPLEGSETRFGPFSLQVIHAPGHTPGSVAFLEKETGILFSGDTLFSGKGVGRTDLPKGDTALLAKSLRELDELEWETLCPGHGPTEKRRKH